jgi:hypothetical protein
MNNNHQVNSTDVVIVVPIYKASLNDTEQQVLRRCASVLRQYDVVLVHPTGLNVESYKKIASSATAQVFPSEYFGSIAGYNQLLISDIFYQAFERYQYMLIYQLDAWVFEDSLLEWCNKGYDYIGAPWIEEPMRGRTSGLIPFTKLCLNKVGNGGLSLRRVSTHLRIAKRLRLLTRFYCYNEDVFWSVLVPMIFWSYRKPTVREALEFAFEYKPRESYVKIGNKLPFGCHAWERTDRDFWGQFVK